MASALARQLLLSLLHAGSRMGSLALVVLETPEPGGPQSLSHKLLTVGCQWREMTRLCVHTLC